VLATASSSNKIFIKIGGDVELKNSSISYFQAIYSVIFNMQFY